MAMAKEGKAGAHTSAPTSNMDMTRENAFRRSMCILYQYYPRQKIRKTVNLSPGIIR